MIRYLKNGEVSEESIHKSIIEWINISPPLKDFRNFIIHIPNQGKRTARFGRKLKDMGMRKGVSDLFIAAPKRGYSGAWIELKSKHGILSKDQFDFLQDMTSQNYCTNVCKSYDECIEFIHWYLELKK